MDITNGTIYTSELKKFNFQFNCDSISTSIPNLFLPQFAILAAAEQQVFELGSNPAPWKKEEQTCLEKALKEFPAGTAQRWDKIAEKIPYRSKKDCMKRYKVCTKNL